MTVPHFQLYGEGESFADPGFVHLETIASRSRPNSWEIRPHSHDTLDQLFVIRSGNVEVLIEGQAIVVAGPAIVHVPASAVHGFVFDDDVAGDVLTFSAELRGSLAAGQPTPPRLAEQLVTREIDAAALDRLAPLLDHLRLECSGHREGWIAASAWLVGLLLLHVGRMAGGADGAPAGDMRLTLFRQLVDRHFREHRPLAFYAGKLAMTERSLTRWAQARLGCPPARYLHRRLLLEARRQLAYGQQPIARIAEELGFADPSYFTRFYRRMTGELPSAIRQADDSRPAARAREAPASGDSPGRLPDTRPHPTAR